jgi:hypothetical protein
LVKSIKDNRSEGAIEKLQAIKQILVKKFGSKKFDTEGMLQRMAEGGTIPRGDFEAIQSFIMGLMCKFELAKGKSDVGEFENERTYYEILRLKLPHLINKWSRKFEYGHEKVSFGNFTDFVMEVAKVDKSSATIRSSADKTESPSQGRRNEAMGPFASGHPDTSANDKRMQEQRRPRSDNKKPTGCKICSEKHQVADCKQFLAMNLDKKVEACRT